MFQKVQGGFAKAFFSGLISATLLLSSGISARAQAPGLAWTNSMGGRIFAEDSSGNVYATSNGIVFAFNSAGALQSSNQICPLPGLAQRDASGNYYFLGSYAGSQDFGGTVLTATGPQGCFLVKYNQTGSLQWAQNFGDINKFNSAGDLAINPDGSLMMTYFTPQSPYIGRYNSNDGSTVWQTYISYSATGIQAFKVTPLSGTNGAFLQFSPGAGSIYGGFYDSNGAFATITSPSFNNGLDWPTSLALNAEPVVGTNNDIFITSAAPYGRGMYLVSLTRSANQTKVWSEDIGFVDEYVLGGNAHDGIYLGADDGSFSKYALDGTVLWSTNYGSPAVSMLIAASGHRFISRNDGSIARLQDDSGNSVPSLIVGVGDGFGSQGFRFHLMGASSTVHQVFCSTNLLDWQSLGMVTNTTDSTPFTDSSATNCSTKFYRAVLVQ